MAERRLARMLHGDVPTLFEAPIAEERSLARSYRQKEWMGDPDPENPNER